MASRLPCTSALTTRLRVKVSWSEARCERKVSSVTRDSEASSRSRCLTMRESAMRRATFSSATTKNSSPASGTPSKPCTSTGREGPASLTFLPWSLLRARTRPEKEPQTKLSPWCRVPSCTSTVATGPRPLSSLASTICPRAGLSGLAFSSRISACRATISSRASRPSRVLAETLATMVSPPQSSGCRPSSASSRSTRSGLAPGLSILFTATIMGTLAARAWLMASRVCSITPSSAATTRMTRSVTCAPRARMAVKASWPGVSRKTISPRLVLTWYAPMCWVMPPASPPVTLVLRMASSKEVLPWSTWPMMVTTGGRGLRLSGASASLGSR